MSPITQLRTQLSSDATCRFVSASEYIDLLTSHNPFQREDVPAANLFGLRDRVTGNRVVIPVEDLEERGIHMTAS